MRAPSARVFNDAVTVTTKVYRNVDGEPVPTPTTTTRLASVQPMKGSRAHAHNLEQGVNGFTVYFAASPGVNVGDSITWQGLALVCLGDANDEGGRHALWSVDCEQRS